MLSHIPSKVHTKDDNIMNVPELFSTISRLKAFARPLLARTENRIPVRSSRPPSRKTQSSFVKNEDDFIKESAFVQKDVVVDDLFASHLLFLKVRPSDDDGAKKEIELDVVAALRIASIILLFLLRATCTVTRV